MLSMLGFILLKVLFLNSIYLEFMELLWWLFSNLDYFFLFWFFKFASGDSFLWRILSVFFTFFTKCNYYTKKSIQFTRADIKQSVYNFQIKFIQIFSWETWVCFQKHFFFLITGFILEIIIHNQSSDSTWTSKTFHEDLVKFFTLIMFAFLCHTWEYLLSFSCRWCCGVNIDILCFRDFTLGKKENGNEIFKKWL